MAEKEDPFRRPDGGKNMKGVIDQILREMAPGFIRNRKKKTDKKIKKGTN